MTSIAIISAGSLASALVNLLQGYADITTFAKAHWVGSRHKEPIW